MRTAGRTRGLAVARVHDKAQVNLQPRFPLSSVRRFRGGGGPTLVALAFLLPQFNTINLNRNAPPAARKAV
jgi:hypothetical protein